MPEYFYRAKDGPEKIVEGMIEAPTEISAVDRISAMGYLPIYVRSKAENKKVSALSILVRTKRQTNRQLMFFSRHLASLLKSGVPILKSLYLLAEQESEPGFRDLLNDLVRQIKEGGTLSQTMEKYPGTFFPMYIAIISAGEASGALPEALMRMAAHLKKQEGFETKISHALAYPGLLLAAGAGTIVFVLTFAVPRLSKLFLSLGRELPLVTRIVIGAGDFMSRSWPFLAVLGVLVVILGRWFRQKKEAVELWDWIALRLPIAGKMIFKTELSRFSRTLEISLTNGISFIQALKVALPTINNSTIRQAIEGCYEQIQKGETFGRSLRQYDFFPHLVTDMIQIGEESGRLEEVLLEISELYEQETDDLILSMTTLLEPALILIISAVVGFIVIAMMLPVFEMSAVI